MRFANEKKQQIGLNIVQTSLLTKNLLPSNEFIVPVFLTKDAIFFRFDMLDIKHLADEIRNLNSSKCLLFSRRYQLTLYVSSEKYSFIEYKQIVKFCMHFPFSSHFSDRRYFGISHIS